ncbi:hypothetical protein HD554DRAFT_2040313 [Boletus coccyginus]|nr:hypothetical protein HD554DRAFT_2040313 [Boletus coccyginus]
MAPLPRRCRCVAMVLVLAVWLLGWQTTPREFTAYAERVETLDRMPIILTTGAPSANEAIRDRVARQNTDVRSQVPLLAASACAFRASTRILYTIGYTTGDVANLKACYPSRDTSPHLHGTHIHMDSQVF